MKYFCLSEANAATIRRAHAVQVVKALQSEYSLWWKRSEEGILPPLEDLGIASMPNSPLGKGYLFGTISDQERFNDADIRGKVPRLSSEARRSNRPIVDLLEATEGSDCSADSSRMAACVSALHRSDSRHDETGLRGQEYSLRQGNPDREDLREIDRLTGTTQVQGDRYPARDRKDDQPVIASSKAKCRIFRCGTLRISCLRCVHLSRWLLDDLRDGTCACVPSAFADGERGRVSMTT